MLLPDHGRDGARRRLRHRRDARLGALRLRRPHQIDQPLAFVLAVPGVRARDRACSASCSPRRSSSTGRRGPREHRSSTRSGSPPGCSFRSRCFPGGCGRSPGCSRPRGGSTRSAEAALGGTPWADIGMCHPRSAPPTSPSASSCVRVLRARGAREGQRSAHMNSAARLLRRGADELPRALQLAQPWVFVPSHARAPVFEILLFVYIGRSAGLESDEFYVIGNALQYAAIPCLFAMTHTIAGERFQQTLGFILVSPARRLALFLGRALPVGRQRLLRGAAFALSSAARSGIDISSSAYPSIALVTAVCAFSARGSGSSARPRLRRARDRRCSRTSSSAAARLLRRERPARRPAGWMQTISSGIPFTHGIAAAREHRGRPIARRRRRARRDRGRDRPRLRRAGYALIRVTEVVSRRYATLERA